MSLSFFLFQVRLDIRKNSNDIIIRPETVSYEKVVSAFQLRMIGAFIFNILHLTLNSEKSKMYEPCKTQDEILQRRWRLTHGSHESSDILPVLRQEKKCLQGVGDFFSPQNISPL